MKKLLDKIDQWIYRKGGFLYRVWFIWKGTGEFDEDTGAENGYLERRFFKENK